MNVVARLALVFGALAFSGCASIGYVKDEMTGNAKPDGGITEVIPPSKTYAANPATLRRAVLAILEEQGYIAEELASGAIRTEPKPLAEKTGFQLTGAAYSARVLIRLENSTVTYRARFDKKSNLTMPEQNVEYPEKENELRKAFFFALDKRLVK